MQYLVKQTVLAIKTSPSNVDNGRRKVVYYIYKYVEINKISLLLHYAREEVNMTKG